MKKLLVLSLLSPLTACAAAPWSALDEDSTSPTSLRAPEAPRPNLVAVLTDADPLRAPSGIASEDGIKGSDHSGHQGHSGGHGGTARQGNATGHTSGHSGHGGHTGHGAKQGSAHDGHGGHSGSAPDAGIPAPSHDHHQH